MTITDIAFYLGILHVIGASIFFVVSIADNDVENTWRNALFIGLSSLVWEIVLSAYYFSKD